jgi:hypothetical protein
MPMDPQAQVILDLVNATGFGDISEMEPTAVRELMASLSAPSTVHVDRVSLRQGKMISNNQTNNERAIKP